MTHEEMRKLHRKDDVMVEWPGEDSPIQALVLRVGRKQCLAFADVTPGLHWLDPEDIIEVLPEIAKPMDTITIQGRNLSVQGAQ